MNGIEWLLDTNFILGLLKSSPETLAMIGDRQIDARRCGYSAITRMELLIGNPEKAKQKLGWEPKTTLEQLCAMMVEADLQHNERVHIKESGEWVLR